MPLVDDALYLADRGSPRRLARQLADDKRRLGEPLFGLAVRLAHDPRLTRYDSEERLTLDPDPQPVTAALLACPAALPLATRPADLAAHTAAVTATIARLHAGRMAREDARLPAGEIAPRGPRWGQWQLPEGPLEARLQRRLAAEITPWLRVCYDFDVTGSLEVRVSRDPQAVGICAEVGCARRFPVSPATAHAVRVVRYVLTVPGVWWRRVKRPELILLDGQLTLDAEPLPAPPGLELFAVTAIRQGLRYRLHTAHRVAARDVATRITAVAADAERAVRLLRQRCPAPAPAPCGRGPRVVALRRGPDRAPATPPAESSDPCPR